MNKRMVSILVVVTVFICMALPVFATNEETSNDVSSVTYLENGDYVVISLDEEYAPKATTKTGNKNYSYYHANGTLLWKVTLTGTFSYTYGVSSICTKASHKITIYDSNWLIGSASSSKSGNTAYADVTMDQKYLGIVVGHINVDLSLTCDKYGNLT